jgi:hypothetical protein
MALSTLPTFAADGTETVPTATDLNTIIAGVNTNETAIATLEGEGLNAQLVAEARTATADGLTTGIVSATTDHVNVTAGDANHIIALPTPSVGKRVTLVVAATGYELRTSAPETVGINGGTGADAESAIAADTYVECFCATATNWICWSRIADGTLAVVQVAAP